MQIIGSNGYTYIRCFQKSRRSDKNILLFILTNFPSYNPTSASLELPETPLLVTLDAHATIYKDFKRPPSNWIIMNTSLTNDTFPELPAGWPTPSFSNNVTNITDVTIQYIYPFADTVPAIHFAYNSIDIIVINNVPVLTETGEESIFKEKFDIVIVNTTDNTPIMKIREKLRPLYMIVLPSIKINDAFRSTPNIIQPDLKCFTYNCYKDSKGRLHIKKKK